MVKKKKYPKLPNGFGSIKKLSGKRTNPFGVYPPQGNFTGNGVPSATKAICYVDDWYKGFYVLMAYRNGTYTENTLEELKTEMPTPANANTVVTKIIAEYNNKVRVMQNMKTFSEVYEEFYDYKYNQNKKKTFSEASKYSTKAAYKNCSAIHNEPFAKLRLQDLQKVVDDCDLKHSSKELIVSLIKQMYAYADSMDIVNKNYAEHLCVNTPDDDEQGIPFTENEIDILWNNKSDPAVASILIMIYSGYRIKAYKNIKIDLQEKYFQGGVKTSAGKNRIVPIHSLILPLIKKELPLFKVSDGNFRKNLFYPTLERLGIERHTPHDCRHTFSWLCDKYKVDPLTKKMLMGHSLGNDVTDAKYGHRTLAELQTEMEKIRHW